MLSIIKTAIITITLSFISGVLLDYYKNIAPRIICRLGKSKIVRIDNKKMKMYNLTIKNSSKQTIHNLSVNLHAHNSELKLRNTEITRGLKFSISDENRGYNVNIPFLSKNDEFSVRLFTNCVGGSNTRPIIILRSPEKFKRIDSKNNKNDKLDKRSNKEDYSANEEKQKEKTSNKFIEVFEKIAGNKKAVAAILTALCVLFSIVIAKEYIAKAQDKKLNTYSQNKNLDNTSNKIKEDNNANDNSNNSSSNSNSSKVSGNKNSTIKNNYSSNNSNKSNNNESSINTQKNNEESNTLNNIENSGDSSTESSNSTESSENNIESNNISNNNSSSSTDNSKETQNNETNSVTNQTENK